MIARLFSKRFPIMAIGGYVGSQVEKSSMFKGSLAEDFTDWLGKSSWLEGGNSNWYKKLSSEDIRRMIDEKEKEVKEDSFWLSRWGKQKLIDEIAALRKALEERNQQEKGAGAGGLPGKIDEKGLWNWIEEAARQGRELNKRADSRIADLQKRDPRRPVFDPLKR
jgi:hypothetical protein